MTGRTVDLCDVISPDRLATQIVDVQITWDNARQPWKNDKEEVRRYVYATNTTQTSNSALPWKNKTTIPKLCQIRDNLYANYTATMFPQRKSHKWEANEQDPNSKMKAIAIENFMSWVVSQPSFKHEMDKIVLDYIDYGNCFVTVAWEDQRVETPQKTQMGYVGPVLRRINPNDIVMNPTAEHFVYAPKIIKSVVSMGEIKKYLDKLSNDENREMYEELWKYMREIRHAAVEFDGEWAERDRMYSMEGFSSFREYLSSNSVEVLTFYGDIYDDEKDEFLENHVIVVVDRHKVISKRPNPSFFGYPPIFHASWRKRQDNLWGMGPLDNLVGLQYRMDHVENMKADVFDLITYPVQKVKGFVEDFTWQPGEKIFVSEEGDVEMVVPDVQALQANLETQFIAQMMEEMAGAPKEAMGFRTPGEKTKYEVQRLENAASRVFQNKIKQFEEQILEPVLNAMLELSRRNMSGTMTIKVFDDQTNAAIFETLTVEDITGIGRIKPIASRHFAEQAELVQNLTSLSQSNLWPFVQPHFSGIKMAKLLEEIFNIGQYGMVVENIALTEQSKMQKHASGLEQNMLNEMGTASGIGDDFDIDQFEEMQTQMMQNAEQEAPTL